MILVTGGTGFIGGHLVGRLLARGERVRAVVRRSGAFDGTAVDVVRADLLSGTGLDAALDGVSTVIHLAGVTKALSTSDYYEGNVRASENLARAISTCGRAIRVVHVSSLAAIGPSPDGSPVTEETEPKPFTHYGKSKLQGERAVRALLPDAVVVRPPVVYGPRDTDVFQLLKAVNRGIVVQIAGGERWFSAIYVGDLVDGILAAADAPQAAGRDYFLAHRSVASWTELGGIAARVMRKKPRVVEMPAAAANAVGLLAEGWAKLTRKPGIVSREKVSEAQCRYWTCETERARRELGFDAPTSLNEGLKVTLAWYRGAGWLQY